jgi:hypothetical protein
MNHGPISSRLRGNYFNAVDLRGPAPKGKEEKNVAEGCSKRSSLKALPVLSISF